jgi:hypothetical protein
MRLTSLVLACDDDQVVLMLPYPRALPPRRLLARGYGERRRPEPSVVRLNRILSWKILASRNILGIIVHKSLRKANILHEKS